MSIIQPSHNLEINCLRNNLSKRTTFHYRAKMAGSAKKRQNSVKKGMIHVFYTTL